MLGSVSIPEFEHWLALAKRSAISTVCRKAKQLARIISILGLINKDKCLKTNVDSSVFKPSVLLPQVMTLDRGSSWPLVRYRRMLKASLSILRV